MNMIRNLTPAQIVILIITTAGVLNGSTAQLIEWFGPKVAHNIISVISFGQTLIGAWAMALTSQGAVVKQVLAMPGIEKVDVNGLANQTLSAIAVDQNVNKIAPTPAAMDQVTQTAKGT